MTLASGVYTMPTHYSSELLVSTSLKLAQKILSHTWCNLNSKFQLWCQHIRPRNCITLTHQAKYLIRKAIFIAGNFIFNMSIIAGLAELIGCVKFETIYLRSIIRISLTIMIKITPWFWLRAPMGWFTKVLCLSQPIYSQYSRLEMSRWRRERICKLAWNNLRHSLDLDQLLSLIQNWPIVETFWHRSTVKQVFTILRFW